MYSQSFCTDVNLVVSQTREINFYGAAIVTNDGTEIPITAEMVERALMHACGSVGTGQEGCTCN